MQRKTSFAEGEYYHLYNRGVDKRVIFSSVQDYKRFIMLLYLANTTEDVRISNILRASSHDEVFLLEQLKPLVSIGAFCLMPNHFHLLATPLVENGISRFMLKVQTGYSMYFNTKNERSGSLFQGPFKAEHASDDVYLKYLFSYIHLNPAKLKNPLWKKEVVIKGNSLQKFVETYPYSSLKEYVSDEHKITAPDYFPTYFSSKEDVVAHITDWLGNDQSSNDSL